MHPPERRLRVIDGRLPVLSTEAARRPFFGSADVAPYGAVGLDDPDVAPPMPSSTGGVRTPDGTRETFQVEPADPLRLVGPLAHHDVDGRHLWIAVEEGKLVVADAREHELLQAYQSGCSPVDASAHLQQASGLDADEAWTTTLQFLGRLAAAGFIEGIRGYHAVKKVRPHAFARLHLTQRCQLECVHCYTSSSPHLPSDGELPLQRWLQLVADFADNGGQKILFTGGEALVYRGCLDIMQLAHDRGLEVTLFTNGILVPRYLDRIAATADIVQVSVDGPSAETHDAIRGTGSFVKAVKAIRVLLDAGVQTRVSTTIMMNNWEAVKRDLPGFIAGFEGTPLSFRVSYGAMSHGRGEQLDHSLDTQQVRQFVNALLTRVRTTENRDEGRNVVQKISGCGYAEQLVVAPDGLVYPCHLLSGALGHVDDLPLSGITRYLARTAEAFGVDHRRGCQTCDLRNLCGGSCRVEDEKHTGTRLATTCTPDDKLRKKRFLVKRYAPA